VFFRGTREDIPKQFRDFQGSRDPALGRPPTYFAADIAYHDAKLARGFDHLVNILGADSPRLRVAAQGRLARNWAIPAAQRRRRQGRALSGDRLEVLLVQMVALLREGKPVPMGKRSGEFVTLRDVIDESPPPSRRAAAMQRGSSS